MRSSCAPQARPTPPLSAEVGAALAVFAQAPVAFAVLEPTSTGFRILDGNRRMRTLGGLPGACGELVAELLRVGRSWPLTGGAGHRGLLVEEGALSARGEDPSALGPARYLRDIVDNSSALVYVKDLEGRYLLVNRQFERRFGLRQEEVIGRTDHDLFIAPAAKVYSAHDREVIASGGAIEVEEPAIGRGRVPNPDENEGAWLSIKVALLDEDGSPYGIGGISTDISDAKRAEAAARAARDEAERANRAKSEFLSRVSHELRTPLNAILGFGQLLALESLPDTAAVSVERILSAGAHLLALINEVLEITRIEAGAHHIATDPVAAVDPLTEAIELLRPLATERGVELACDYHGGLGRYVRADRQRLKQVLLNLITNAIKYNRPAGAVRIHFTENEGHLRYLITDTGPGLTSEEASRIFLPFERLAADATDTEGTGLGLALSKSLIEAMGGRISIEHSAPGEGTTFCVELEQSDGPPTAYAAPRASVVAHELWALGRAEVLYAEDNLSNFELVQGILARAPQVRLIPAMQGQLALELATQHRPDVLLLDLDLPDMSGTEVLARLRRDPRTRAIPVVVLSADATPESILELKALGIVDYVTKPIDISRFLGTLRTALRLPEVRQV
jgi:PAS domain S-box-containing protein